MNKRIQKNELTFDDQTGLCAGMEEIFHRLFDYICRFQKLDRPCLESLTLADDKLVREINSQYRGIDRTTDVISFAFEEGGDVVDAPVRDLGELIISVPQAQRQADEFKHPLIRELCFLIIHGTLHNLGYDHTRSEEDARVMYALQNDILNSFDVDWEDARWKPSEDPLKDER